VLYGDPWHLGRVVVALDYLGHGDRWSVLDGGLTQWRAEGRPVTRDEPVPGRGAYTARPRPEIVVDAAWVRAHLGDPRFAIVDGRTPQEYAGTARESAPRRGHLPGARLLEWNRTFSRPAAAEADTSVTLVPPERLYELLRAAGVTAGRQPVFYCTVGLRASHLYFVARALGYAPRLYDGSWSDWSRLPAADHPIVTGPDPGVVR
jgi:thiosulfate/3-mercaptopyruvate sulfurtransferase